MNLYEWGLSVPWCMTDIALQAMLSLAARAEVGEDELKQVMHGPKSLALRDGRRREDSATMTVIDGVARIVIDGPIYRYASFFTRYSGGVTAEALGKDFASALADPAVGAILMVIDSPGGEAIAINELADTIYASRGRKPIGAYIEGYGASAAYWIASAADLVAVDDSALVGSIGTIFGVPDPSKRASPIITIVSSQSPKKRVDVTTPEGRAVMQQMADDLTEVFIAKVMRHRGLSRQQILDLEGGMRIGQQAIDAGLADRIGAEDLLIRELAAKAAQRAPLLLPPARLPAGSPLRLEESMQVFSKEWWSNLFAAQAETEPAAAPAEPRTVQISQTDLDRIEAAAASLVSPQAAQSSNSGDAREARMVELERQLAEQQTHARQAAAAAFADGAVRAHQAMPAERQALYDAYIQASEDDSARPLTSGTSRVGQIEALTSSRTPHTLTEELIAATSGGVLPSSGSTRPMSEERKEALMSMTTLGRAALARKRARSA